MIRAFFRDDADLPPDKRFPPNTHDFDAGEGVMKTLATLSRGLVVLRFDTDNDFFDFREAFARSQLDEIKKIELTGGEKQIWDFVGQWPDGPGWRAQITRKTYLSQARQAAIAMAQMREREAAARGAALVNGLHKGGK
jgi:hypothetical protein